MITMYDYLVFIGRFQPFHLAHWQTVKIALAQAKKVILCLGSAQEERSLKNPFLAVEREQMILQNFEASEQKRIHFAYIVDVYNDEKWQKQVREKVSQIVQQTNETTVNIGLIGHHKDDSTYYLNLFPEWERVDLESLHNAISATPLRQAYYQGQILTEHFPQGTVQFLQDFQQTAMFKALQQQYHS